MKPDDPRDALHIANEMLDERPDARVRAAVLAAASRAVDARPQATSSVGPFARRHWPLSAAALLVVSLTTGLLVTRALRDEPDRVLTVEATTRAVPSTPSSTPVSSAAEAAPLPQAQTPAPIAADAPPPRRPSVPPMKRSASVVDTSRREVTMGPSTRAKAMTAEPAPTEAKTEVARSPSTSASPASDATPSSAPTAAGDRATTLPPYSPSTSSASAVRSTSLARMDLIESRNALHGRPGIEPPTPQAWLERIMKMRAAGDDDAADREVEALHRRYPDFAIPADASRLPDPQ